jgi:hypothetical protein
MIDPVSIGLAFTAVQSVVGNIKSAIGTGKDIHGIVKDIGKFLNLSSDIHKANMDLKLQLLKKSDQELESIAFQTAWMANQVIEHRKQLKELLIWSGHGDIWDNMVREHTRLMKEKREMEEQQKKQERERKKKLAETLFAGIIAILVIITIVPFAMIGFQLYTR